MAIHQLRGKSLSNPEIVGLRVGYDGPSLHGVTTESTPVMSYKMRLQNGNFMYDAHLKVQNEN